MISIAINMDGFSMPTPDITTASAQMIIRKNRLPLEFVADRDEASYRPRPDLDAWLRAGFEYTTQILQRTCAEFSARPLLITRDLPGGPLGDDRKKPQRHWIMFTAFRHREGYEWHKMKPLGSTAPSHGLLEEMENARQKIYDERPQTFAPPHMLHIIDTATSVIGASMEFASGLNKISRH